MSNVELEKLLDITTAIAARILLPGCPLSRRVVLVLSYEKNYTIDTDCYLNHRQ